ncbi:hypothetical protein D3C72_1101920 [compost metagenome]
MHAPRLGINPQAASQRGAQARRRGLAAFAVQPPHPLDVTSKVPFADEGRQQRLRIGRRAARQQPADPVKAWHLRLGHHQVRQAHAGKQHLAERPRVQHPPLRIQTLQRGQRTADVAVFAVVVVFHNPGLTALGPVQQRLAAG